MLRQATRICERNIVTPNALAEMVSHKAPSEIRALLFQTSKTVTTWEQFVQTAEELAPIAYRDNMLTRIEKVSKSNIREPPSLRGNQPKGFKPRPFYQTKGYDENRRNNIGISRTEKRMFYCQLHGYGAHKTSQCDAVTGMVKREKVRLGIRTMEEREGENKGEENNNLVNKDLIYYFNRLEATKNPFFVKGELGERPRTILLDTGADVSLIDRKDLQGRSGILKPYDGVVKSVSGDILKIIGKSNNIKISMGKEIITFSPLVVEESEYIILGADVIYKAPGPLIKILELQWKHHKEISVRTIDEGDLKHEFRDIFKTEIGELNVCNSGTHSIETDEARPICQRNGRIPISQEAAIEAEIEKNLRLNIIRESHSPWCSRIVMVTKSDGSWRMCIDYRALNAVTIKDSYVSPRIDEIYDALTDAGIFSVLDATSGYYQIAMEEKDKEKTAFSFKGRLYEFNRMPFGLCNAPATFQRTMDEIFSKENRMFVIPYLDDIIVYSKSRREHEKHLRIVLGKLKAAGLSLNEKKSKFFREQFKILGNIISKGMIKADPERIEKLLKYPEPKIMKELRSFLGTINYGREFIKDIAGLTAPLYELLKGERKSSTKSLVPNEKQKETFNKIKKTVSESTIRAQSQFDREFIVTTDASEIGIAVILSQKDSHGNEKMISTFSRTLQPAEKNYTVTEKELLGIVKGVNHFRHYLLGKNFILRTDHKALTFLWTAKHIKSRLIRWSLELSEYTFRIEYVKGEDNAADGLSRINPTLEVRSLSNNTLIHEEIAEILEEYHKISGHGSPNTMKFMVRQTHRWSGMFKDIDEHCSRCLTCLQAGNGRVNTKTKVIHTSHENDLWQIDLIGRLQDKEKNGFIFVAIDHYSKWIETKVLERKTSAEIIKAIEELIIRKHGIPKRILSDMGLEFNNKEVLALQEKYFLKWEFASPYHHQTTGAVERGIQSLFNILKRQTNYGEKNWKPWVERATLAYNLSYNRAIGTSPYIFKNGSQKIFEIDKKLGVKPKNYSKQVLIQRRDENFKKYEKK